MVTIVELKRCLTYTGIFGVVVGELRYREEPYPIILLLIYENTKVRFHRDILAFCLSVGLRV